MIIYREREQFGFYSDDQVKMLWGQVSDILSQKYRICVLQDMRGPTGVNCINDKKRVFVANSHGIKTTGHVSDDAEKLAFEIAGQPKLLDPSPTTFIQDYEQKWTHVALYAWNEFWFTDSIEKPYHGHRVGVIRAARLNVETSDIYG